MNRIALALALAFALALTACDDHADHDDEHDDHDLIAEACEHGALGPSVAITAATPADAPAIQSHRHSRVDITLPPDAADPAADPATHTGAVAYNVTEPGDHAFFLTADIPLTFTANGTPLTLEATTPIDTCEAIAVQHTLELPAGEVILTFGPTALTEIGVVFEAIEDTHAH